MSLNAILSFFLLWLRGCKDHDATWRTDKLIPPGSLVRCCWVNWLLSTMPRNSLPVIPFCFTERVPKALAVRNNGCFSGFTASNLSGLASCGEECQWVWREAVMVMVATSDFSGAHGPSHGFWNTRQKTYPCYFPITRLFFFCNWEECNRDRGTSLLTEVTKIWGK